MAGEIALKALNRIGQSRSYSSALAVARQQQAKSWELRASMSLARLWRDQGKASTPVNYWLRSITGSLKGSTRSI